MAPFLFVLRDVMHIEMLCLHPYKASGWHLHPERAGLLHLHLNRFQLSSPLP